ncbi:MAG: HAD family hydrolase [Gemmiger sp.]
MAIQLLICDLDGTLLGPDSVITPRTAQALERARQAGLRLLVTTGRTWSTAAPLLRRAGANCDFVLLNGAEYRTAQGELIRTVPLPAATARHTASVLRRYSVGMEINTDQGDFTTDTALCPTAQPLPRLASFWARRPEVRKIFGFSRNPDALTRAREKLQRLPDATVTASADWNLEVTARDAQKGTTARWAAQRYGIAPDQALVFGDGCNDLSLFRAFVHTRAMGNAAAPLQALAERVIEPNTEDGVAREIDRLLAETAMGNSPCRAGLPEKRP